jgi:hypothetical protein
MARGPRRGAPRPHDCQDAPEGKATGLAIQPKPKYDKNHQIMDYLALFAGN